MPFRGNDHIETALLQTDQAGDYAGSTTPLILFQRAGGRIRLMLIVHSERGEGKVRFNRPKLLVQWRWFCGGGVCCCWRDSDTPLRRCPRRIPTCHRCCFRAHVQDICDSTTGAINRVLKSTRRKDTASMMTAQELARTLAAASKIKGLVVWD